MLVESHEKLTGNARFEGFAIDLASELAGLLGFNFTFKLVDDDKVLFAIILFNITLLFFSTAEKPRLGNGTGCWEK